MGGKAGYLSIGRKDISENIASIADWDDTVELQIGADDVNLVTTYSGQICKQISAESASGTIYYTTRTAPTVSKRKYMDKGQLSGKLPAIHSILGTGNGSSEIIIVLYLQRI